TVKVSINGAVIGNNDVVVDDTEADVAIIDDEPAEPEPTPDPSNDIYKVKKIYSNSFAFAALRSDGSVVTWGDPSCGGLDSAPEQVTTLNSGVVKIFSNKKAFPALKVDGSVVAWGNP